MTVRAIHSLLLCLGLAGCGGGSVSILWTDGDFSVFGGSAHVTVSTTIELNGNAFLPQGATCTFSGFAQRDCICEPGPLASGQWTNSATGAAGRLELAVVGDSSCMPMETVWRTPGIALAPGPNFITLTLIDDAMQGRASVTVMRN